LGSFPVVWDVLYWVSSLEIHTRFLFTFAELYGPIFGQSPMIDRLLLQLKRKIQAELRFQKELTRLIGSLDMIFASTALIAQR
jgi:hypothetical protein